MSRIDDLLARQAHDLAAVQEAEARRMLRALNDARRQVAEQLDGLRASGGDRVMRFTTQHARVVMAQLEASIRQLTARMDSEAAASAVTLGVRAYHDLLGVIRANEPEFTDAGNRIEYRVVSRLSQEQGLLLHRFSTRTYGSTLIGSIQRELAAGAARGLTIPQLTARVAGTDGVFARLRGRAELIARVETNTAYNAMHQAALEEAAAVLDDPGQTEDRLQRQANEVFDSRTCAFSRAVDGMVTDINKPWRVPVARVDAAAKGVGRPASGIVWPIVNGEYVAARYIFHYADRGRQVPYRASWEEMPSAAESSALAVPTRMAA